MSGSKIFYAAAALLVASCSGKENLPQTRTPLTVEASLSGQLQTKATDDAFESGDKLLVYLRHMADIVDVPADKAPMLVEFTVDAAGKLTPEFPLYWDDFSDSSTLDTDLRTAGHGLQSYYGYCYNGGTPFVALSPSNGSLKWKVGDQTTAEDVKKADLLWSQTQTAVPYSHTPANAPITVPFSHAMSQVTVVLTLGDGFERVKKPLENTSLVLYNMNKECTFYAPEGTYNSFTDGTTVQMYGKDNQFVAIVAPGTPLTVGEKFLDITDVDGNNYTLNITDAMLDATHWNATQMAPGVNYLLNITLSKTAVAVQATLDDWMTVDADGTGKIQFPDDVVDLTVTAGTFENGTSFDLYRYETTPGEKSATVTYDCSKWVSDPVLYWPNQSTNYYFRAVMDGTEDTLWATTPAHNGFAEGEAIKPRTGNVPLAFEHVKSKLSVTLETSTTASAVDFSDATIAISNLSTTGELNIADGSITPGAVTAAGIPAAAGITDEIVIPQTLGNTSILTITLKDGTVYKLQLNQCKVSGEETAITEWERGKSYNYTIHVEKEEISFRALVKDWEVTTGSGNANLEWD